MRIDLLGRPVELTGSSGDAYFASAQGAANGTGDIVRLALNLPPNPTILDVGANIGLTSIAMAIARPDATIFAFEPCPVTVIYLRENASRFGNIHPVNAAVSDRLGALRFHASDSAAASHIVGDGHLHQDRDTATIGCTTIDRFCSSKIRPDLIKIDVEGHEPEVLAGAARRIQDCRPVIAMEFNSWALCGQGGHNPASVATALWNAFEVEGYDRPIDFLHENMVKQASFSDIVMRLKPGSRVPSLVEMSLSPMARRLAGI